MTRDELNEQARQAGITDPESYPNMDELSDAIAARQAGPGGDVKTVDNDTIPHTDTDAPLTTRSDATDLGVPMAEARGDGQPDAPGPEDALDPNARGDYRDRVNQGPHVAMVPKTPERDEETGERGPNVEAVEVAPGA